ncbi:hypothetical protein GGR50DRAFT_150916 [Xylaria sp. CBS 124048]|nr:hypothetical protein GGR50DRAFT_150916 [Xylaria sp. CBS 124048]
MACIATGVPLLYALSQGAEPSPRSGELSLTEVAVQTVRPPKYYHVLYLAVLQWRGRRVPNTYLPKYMKTLGLVEQYLRNLSVIEIRVPTANHTSCEVHPGYPYRSLAARLHGFRNPQKPPTYAYQTSSTGVDLVCSVTLMLCTVLACGLL